MDRTLQLLRYSWIIIFFAHIACEGDDIAGTTLPPEVSKDTTQNTGASTEDAAGEAVATDTASTPLPEVSEPVCPEQETIVVWVSLESTMISNGKLPVPKDSTSPLYRITAAGLTDDGDDVSNAPQFIWSSKQGDIAEIKSLNAKHDYVEVTTHKDFFDTESAEAPPSSEISACITNLCGGASCGECQAQVCEKLDVVGVVNIEANWVLDGATFPFPFEVKIWQEGDVFYPAGGDKNSYDGLIYGSHVEFKSGNYKYVGNINSLRDHIEGEATEIGKESSMGTWFADRTGG